MKTKAGKSKTKRAGKQRFNIIEFTNPSGEIAFRVAGYKPDGSRVRENYRTQEEAVTRKAELDIEAANIVTATASRMKVTRLTDAQIKVAEIVFARIGDRDLNSMVDFYLANYREPIRQSTVQKAYDLFIQDREKQNRRPDTLRNLRGRLGMFCRLYGTKQVSEITVDDCREFVFRPGTSPRNQINDRLAVSNFLNWCVRRQFTAANNMTSVDRPGVDSHEPSVLSLADCRRLLVAAQDHKDAILLPYVAVSLFAGLRPTEIARLNWDRIDIKEGTITLDGSMAKTRQRRIVKLPGNAVAWLAPLATEKPAFLPDGFRKHFDNVKKLAGFGSEEAEKAKAAKRARKAKNAAAPVEQTVSLRPWIQDYMRHTAISNYLALHKHEGEAASWAGNSPNVIHQHYKGLVKETDAKDFWSITPQTIKTKVIQLQTRAAA